MGLGSVAGERELLREEAWVDRGVELRENPAARASGPGTSLSRVPLRPLCRAASCGDSSPSMVHPLGTSPAVGRHRSTEVGECGADLGAACAGCQPAVPVSARGGMLALRDLELGNKMLVFRLARTVSNMLSVLYSGS
ncbi:hypothetical protein GCM10010199_33400 [Dactylosporangium roseum]